MPAELATTMLAALFHEANHRDRQAREALFLTFSADLGFFESQVLGTVRGTGAAVTVVSDARVYEPDPRAVRAAGLRYSIGLAHSPAVFHPKLTVVAGPRRATVGIGSGNLTIGGWQLNDEVLAVATGDIETGCPPLLRQVADWLTELTDSDHIHLGPTARYGILRTAAQLHTLTSAAPETSDRLRLIGNHRHAIIGQLPNDPVDELRLFAPFHDLPGRALTDLITALSPERVSIALQEGVTVIDPHALLAVADLHGVQLRFDRLQPGTYRHGKLVDAYRQGSCVWTLSGSPNLSSQAMSRSVTAGGNCELALLDRSHTGLYPPSIHTIPRAELTAVTSGPPSAEENPDPRPVHDGLLEATVEAGTLTLLFVQPVNQSCSIEISGYRSDPDQFEPVAELARGRAHHHLDADPDWSYPLRLRVRLDGKPGPIHFVTRPDQVTIRVRGGGGVRVPDLDPDQLFADATQAREWLSAVTQVALQFTTAPAGTHGPQTNRAAHSSTGQQPTWDDAATWQDYVDSAAQRLGESMLGFAFGGLPRIGTVSPQGRAAWEDDFTTRTDETTTDTKQAEPDDGLHDDETQTGPPTSLRDVGAADRQRYRRWLHDLVVLMPRMPAIDRAAFARLVLRATRMTIWEPHTESSWYELLLAAARALPGDDIRPEHLPEMSALTQVIIHELGAAAQRIGRSRAIDNTTALAAYLTTEQQVRGLLAPVDEALIEQFAATLRVRGTIAPDAALIADHAAQALGDNPADNLRRQLALRHPDLTMNIDGNTITVQTDGPRPLHAAGQILDGLAGDWAVFSASDSGRRGFAAQVGTTLLTAALHNDKVRFSTYQITPLASVTRITSGDDTRFDSPIRAIERRPLDTVGPLGAHLLAHLNIEVDRILDFIKGHSSPS